MSQRKRMKKAVRVRHVSIIKQIDEFFQNSRVEIVDTDILRRRARNNFAIYNKSYCLSPHFFWVGPHGKKQKIKTFNFFNVMKYGITVLKWMDIKVDGRLIKSDDFYFDPQLDSNFLWHRVTRLASLTELQDKIKSTYDAFDKDSDRLLDEYLQSDYGIIDTERQKCKIMEKAAGFEFLYEISDENLKFVFDNLDSLDRFVNDMTEKRIFIEKMGFAEFKKLIHESSLYNVMKS